MLIGYHVSIAKSIDLAFDRAIKLTCNTFQLFLMNPRSWHAKELGKEEIMRFRKKNRVFNIPIFAHMPYLPNLASSNKEIYEKSISALNLNIERAKLLNIKNLILHLGSSVGNDKKDAIERVISALNNIDNNDISLILENEAGFRNSIGSDIESLIYILDRLEGKNKGICLDTCHLFASGYDIRDKKVVKNIIEETSNFLKVIHLNDAKYNLGSGKDRHENIGYGYIGIDGFKSFLSFDEIVSKPLILETPMERSGVKELNLVRSIVAMD